MNESEFIVVQSKSRRRRKSAKFTRVERDSEKSPSEVDIEKLRQNIEVYEENLISSEFFKSAEESLNQFLPNFPVKNVLCLGIGKISDCLISRYQLAFISLIAKKLKVQISFYDPILSAEDKLLLERLNHVVLNENKEGKYLTEDPTLYFLPHCPKQITNNLLFKNWTNKRIQNILLICNSFKSIIEATPERLLRPNGHYLLEINPYIHEIEIKNNFQYKDIFNDFSIHQVKDLKNIPSTLWEYNPDPVYPKDDLELVQNGSN